MVYYVITNDCVGEWHVLRFDGNTNNIIIITIILRSSMCVCLYFTTYYYYVVVRARFPYILGPGAVAAVSTSIFTTDKKHLMPPNEWVSRFYKVLLFRPPRYWVTVVVDGRGGRIGTRASDREREREREWGKVCMCERERERVCERETSTVTRRVFRDTQQTDIVVVVWESRRWWMKTDGNRCWFFPQWIND